MSDVTHSPTDACTQRLSHTLTEITTRREMRERGLRLDGGMWVSEHNDGTNCAGTSGGEPTPHPTAPHTYINTLDTQSARAAKNPT